MLPFLPAKIIERVLVAFLAGRNHRAGTGFRMPGSDGVSASFHTPGDDSLTNVLVVEKME
jgi:hypothetical protein